MQLLTTYADRAAHDKDRLAQMMHYAETASCRTQVLREYFAEDPGEPCGRCDNCERGLHAENDLIAAAESDKQARRSRRRKAAPPVAETEQNSSSPPRVTEVESMHGTIHTTAPETLPKPEADELRVGDRVRHQRFGLGQVRDVHGTNALVKFPKAGEKRLIIGVLKRAG